MCCMMRGMVSTPWVGRSRGHLARGGTIDDVIVQHERILGRVRARDPLGATAAMREHLAQTARDLRAAFALADTLNSDTLDSDTA
jgi:DNA-binding GntR family transcriptional regulator